MQQGFQFPSGLGDVTVVVVVAVAVVVVVFVVVVAAARLSGLSQPAGACMINWSVAACWCSHVGKSPSGQLPSRAVSPTLPDTCRWKPEVQRAVYCVSSAAFASSMPTWYYRVALAAVCVGCPPYL